MIGANPVWIDPRAAAFRRAVRAIFYLQDRAHAPFYVYAELSGVPRAVALRTSDEATDLYAALQQTPGEVYVALFDAASRYWPDPVTFAYRPAGHAPSAIAGSGNARGQYGNRGGLA